MPASRHPGNLAAAAPLVEKLSTRITSDVERRLRIYAAMHDLTIGAAVTIALDRALPSLNDIGKELTRDTTPPQTGVPGPRSTSKESH